MNEQLQSKLVEILAGIQAATKAAGDFALEQLPDIAQQYVAYGRVSVTLTLVAVTSLFFGALSVFLFKGLLSNKLDQYGLWPDERIVATMIGALHHFYLVL